MSRGRSDRRPASRRERKAARTTSAMKRESGGARQEAAQPDALAALLPPRVGTPDGGVAPAAATVRAPTGAGVRETQLVVEVAGALYAVPISDIEEILPMRDVSPLPRSAASVRGVLFLRGHAVTVIDMGVLLGGAPAHGTRIVVLVLEGERYGLVVDRVLKVVPAAELENLSAPASALGASQAVCAVARLSEQIISLIDLERLIPAGAATHQDS